MGALCSKGEDDGHTEPGRTVSTQAASAARTSRVPARVGGPARTLGGGSGAAGSTSGGRAAGVSGSGSAGAELDDARQRAAEAAEARAKASTTKPTGKLGAALAEQKRQTRSDTLNAASREERAVRDVEAGREVRAYN